MRLDLDFGRRGRFASAAKRGSKAMSPPDEDPTAEISESLRILGEAEVRWAQLVSKFQARLHIPTAADEFDPFPPSSTVPPYAS